jgi:hypothetical protein
MSKSFKILKYLPILIIVALMTGCASSQSSFQKKRTKASRVNTSQLGRNKFYFSTGYQKKLTNNYKKK